MTLGERMKEVRRRAGLKQADFGALFDVKAGTVTSWETGLRNPSGTILAAACKMFGLNREWLETGEGEMFLDLGPDAELERIFDLIQASDDQTIRAIVRVYWRLPDEGKKILRQAILDIAEEIKKSQGESPGQ